MIKNIRARLTFSAFLVVSTLICWWLGGFNFDARGEDAALCFLTVLIGLGMGISCPLFDSRKSA